MMLQAHTLGIQMIDYVAALPAQAHPLRSLLLNYVRQLSAADLHPRTVREASVVFNAVLASPLCEAIDLATKEKFDPYEYLPPSPMTVTDQRTNLAMYRAALSYYGLPANYRRIYRKPADGRGLIPCTIAEAAKDGVTCWAQVNIPNQSLKLKKALNDDIAVYQNLTLDFEYQQEPQRAHAIGVELAYWLEQAGYCPKGLAVEDTGAGVHIVIPLVTIQVQQEFSSDFARKVLIEQHYYLPDEITLANSGALLLNIAVGNIVKQSIEPQFRAIATRYRLPALPLDGHDISRLLSMPGMYRPGGNKDNEASYLQGGYVRRWLYPYVGDKYPSRQESEIMSDLIRAEVNHLLARKPEPKVVKPVTVAAASGDNGDQAVQKEERRKQAYIQAIVQGELEKLRQAASGGRNNTLFKVTARLASLAAAGEITEFDFEQEVLSIASQTGLPANELRSTFRSGLRSGRRRPQAIELKEA